MPTVREIFLLDIQAIATDNGAKVSSDSLGMAAMEIFQARFDWHIVWLVSNLIITAPTIQSSPPSSQSQSRTPSPSLSPSPTPRSAFSDVIRTGHKIRERHHMSLFTSTGDMPLHYPHNFGRPAAGDIFVHAGGSFETQTWMRTAYGVWSAVSDGQPHPCLPDHRLYRASPDDRPRWIHKNTVATYKSRKKQLRACELHPSDIDLC